MKTKYYDWQKTLSYDAPVTMVITARGYGKTYGLRKQCVTDWIKHKWRFVEITRYAQELSPLMENYFDRLQKEFALYVFKCEKNMAYIALKPTEENEKPQWNILGYFVAMTQFQLLKKLTFNNVKRIFMDESVLEKDDNNHHYLKNEWNILTNIVDTVTRERKDNTNNPRLYLLGNACDIINPYFEHAGISGNPERGYTWHLDKTFLLHNLENVNYATEKKLTLAGKMATGKLEKIALQNDFTTNDNDLIADKTSNSEHLYTLLFENIPLAVWLDIHEGYYYVNTKPPRDMRDTYALTLNEEPNYIMLKRTSPLCKTLYDAFRLRYVRFESLQTCGKFREMLRFCGYR